MKHKTITLKDTVYDKMNLSSSKVNYLLQKRLEEKEKLRKFASKIKKAPKRFIIPIEYADVFTVRYDP